MIRLPWGNVILIIAVLALGGVVYWLWQRNGRGPPGIPGIPGLNGRDGRDGRTGRVGRSGRVTLTEATADLIMELSGKVRTLEREVQKLQVKANSSEARISILQGELALANSEVAALELLIQEQAARIGDLKIENERLHRSLAKVMKKTGALDDPDLDPKR